MTNGAAPGGGGESDAASNGKMGQDGDFAHAAEAIHQAVQNNPDIANLSHQVITENTPQGLRIQLVDQDGRPMVQNGSNEPMAYTRKLLAAVGAIVATLSNRVSIAGHTGGNDSAATGGSRPAAPTKPATCCRPVALAVTASMKLRARPGPNRCCPKTPTRRPIAVSPSC